ncbi:NUDIX domain-containing protein [Streptomyces sp. TE33382]
MTDASPLVTVRFGSNGLVVARDRDDGYVYRIPRGRAAGAGPFSLSLAEALHARIRPAGTAETVLRAWATGTDGPVTVPWSDPSATPPVRIRAGALVIRDGRILLIGFEDEGEPFYEIPGGGVEDGETLHMAAVRELREESGLVGSVVREVARVWKDGRREHYFLMEAEGDIGAAESLDNHGGTPVWVPVARLPTTPVWPRRLAWRTAHWHATGWPAHPAELADSIHDLRASCTW